MANRFLRNMDITEKHRRRAVRQRIVGALCCVVVFCVTYALILPAVTMSDNKALACSYEIHSHEESCYDGEGNIICGYADYVVHTHDSEYCYDSEGNLVCPLEEIQVHEHDASCYDEYSNLICGKREVVLHTHSEACYEDITDSDGNVTGKKLICGLLETHEHRHDDSCLKTIVKKSVMSLRAAEQTATPEGGFMGYVKAVNISSMVDGTEPFDSDNEPGNDSGENNRVVRTFDSIKYNVEAAFQSRDGIANPQQADLSFEISMYKKINEARFDTATMTWLNTGAADWKIEYYAVDGTTGEEYIALIEKSDGTFWKDTDGDGVFETKTSVNEMANGSTPTDGSAYQMHTGAIVRQRLVGTVTLNNADGMFNGTQNFTTGVRVLNAEHNSEFAPTFKVYFSNNPDNYGEIKDNTSAPVTANSISLNTYMGGRYVTRVSCAPLYNMILSESVEYVNYLSWFDFSAGTQVSDANVIAYLNAAGQLRENWDKANPADFTQGSEEVAALYANLTAEQKSNLSNIRYGRMNAIGITAGLSACEQGDKRYTGCSLPMGDVTFDLKLGVDAVVKEGNPDTSGYTAILWDYRPNVANKYEVGYEDSGHTRQWEETSVGSMGRNLVWRGIEHSQFGMRMAPAAYRGDYDWDIESKCYDSGNWTLTGIDGSGRAVSEASDADSVYTFTINDYDFDLDNYYFPDRYYSASGAATDLGVTDFAFFGGFAQVLYVMPYKCSGIVDVSRKLTLGNLEAVDISNQSITLSENARRGETVVISGETDSKDNEVTSAITLYSAGSFTKRNSFNTADTINHTNGPNGGTFLGTSFWGSPQWDENTYAGNNISIVGSAQLTSVSDNDVRAVNLLQLFDGKALSITKSSSEVNVDEYGKYITQSDASFGNFYENTNAELHHPIFTCLFAADPDMPGGYDTNANGVVTYMNTVREDDLVYSDKLYWNEAEQRWNIVKYDIDGDGVPEDLICAGVLAEVRRCCYIDYCYVRTPVTVCDDEQYVGKTVCTVNAATIWVNEGAMDGVSWINGNYDASIGKNTLDGYVDVVSTGSSTDNGYYFYNNFDSFTKVEYGDTGGYASGTAGKLHGATLLILGYKATVSIEDGKLSTDYYAPANGETSVTWTVRNIGTVVDDKTNVKATDITDLAIPVSLTYKGKSSADQQDLFYIVSRSSAISTPAYKTDGSGNLVLDGGGQAIPTGEMWTYDDISSDSANPTPITFLGTYVDDDGVKQPKLYTYYIYADRNINRTELTFHILDAPVGQALPDISFIMNFGSSLIDNDQINATAAISGTGDKRAYSKSAGNQSTDLVIVSKTTSSFLTKRVDKVFGEVGTDIIYTIRFTNNSEDNLSLAYLYDNLPYNGDGRGSKYDMGEDGETTDFTVLSNISFMSAEKDSYVLTDDFLADITVYYSTKPDAELDSILDEFDAFINSEGQYDKKLIDAMLSRTDADAPFGILQTSRKEYYASDSGAFWKLKEVDDNGNPKYTDIAPSDDTLELYDSVTTKYDRVTFFDRTYAQSMGWWNGFDENGNDIWTNGNFTVEGKQFTSGYDAYQEFLRGATGVFLKIENMGPMRDLVMTVDMKTVNNKAEDVYSNDAWEWTPGEGMVPVKSDIVTTEIVSRTISGIVWEDSNLNGRYDEGETLINGVDCTLFKLDENPESPTYGQYIKCTEDVAGRPLGVVTTGSYNYSYTMNGVPGTAKAYKNIDADSNVIYRDEHGHQVDGVNEDQNPDGSYEFTTLAEGKYIVAFSGGALDSYGGATIYHLGGEKDSVNNDGVSLFATPRSNLDTENVTVSGLDNADSVYKYAIAYTLTANSADAVQLHSIPDLVSGKYLANNLVEMYDHLDLGLVRYAGAVLPATGGAGTAVLTAAGIILTSSAGLSLLIIRLRRKARKSLL